MQDNVVTLAEMDVEDEALDLLSSAPSVQFSVTIERKRLLKLLTHVQHVVERRNTIAILSNILLESHGSQLKITATDMDILVTESDDANVMAEGATTVSAHTLFEIVRKLPDDTSVALEYHDATKTLSIRGGASHFSLSTLPADHFPIMAGDQFTHHFTLLPSEICHFIDKTRFAISNEETRYYLNGIYLHIAPADAEGGPYLVAVATDGHRLARALITAPEGMSSLSGIILPKKTVYELRKLLESTVEPVSIALSATKIEFTMQNLRVLSKLMDATYPDYLAVIPKTAGVQITLPRDYFIQMVDRVAIIAEEKTHGIRLHLENGRLTISAAGDAHGSGLETIPIDYHGESMELGFNARYLLEALQAMSGQTIHGIFRDTLAPVTLLDPEDPSILFVLMPMRM
jgi:DNA polymerase-3 subunit beta